jgi:hypothetical protein
MRMKCDAVHGVTNCEAAVARDKQVAADYFQGPPRRTKRFQSSGWPRSLPQHPLDSCIGGHGTDPYEQNTQQSPRFGRSAARQPVHS